jgi:hypothetical protein
MENESWYTYNVNNDTDLWLQESATSQPSDKQQAIPQVLQQHHSIPAGYKQSSNIYFQKRAVILNS